MDTQTFINIELAIIAIQVLITIIFFIKNERALKKFKKKYDLK